MTLSLEARCAIGVVSPVTATAYGRSIWGAPCRTVLRRLSDHATPAFASRRRRVTPSRKSSDAKHDSRSSTSSRSTASESRGPFAPASRSRACCPSSRAARCRRSRPPGRRRRPRSRRRPRARCTSPIRSARSASTTRPVKKRSRVRGDPDHVDEALEAGVAIDQAELRRRHPELRSRSRRPAGRSGPRARGRRPGSAR